MANENEVDEELEEESEDSDTTDWKAKYKEQGIRTRERTKALKDKIAELETKPAEKETKTDEALLQRLERVTLRTAGITHQDDIELAQRTAKKWGVDIEEVIGDEDFKVKLERQQTARTNADATADLKGSGGGGAKNTVEYWLAKGEAPTDKKLHSAYVQAKLKAGRAGDCKKFYND